MKFEALVAIVPEELEETAIETAKTAGAGGVTVVKGRAIGLKEKKIFFGLTLEDNVSLLYFILPRKITMSIFKEIKKMLKLTQEEIASGESAKGLVMTLPITHLAGIDMSEIKLFENEVLDFL